MTTRGLRNNNPANIRHGGQWQGLTESQPDVSFCTFKTMAWGIRALFKILQTYHNRYGLKTVHAVITRFAPPVENDTGAYIDHVAKKLGVMPHQNIDMTDGATLMTLAKAIVKHENGKPAETILESDWEEGARLAGLYLE